jgi:hypothetical protein
MYDSERIVGGVFGVHVFVLQPGKRIMNNAGGRTHFATLPDYTELAAPPMDFECADSARMQAGTEARQ